MPVGRIEILLFSSCSYSPFPSALIVPRVSRIFGCSALEYKHQRWLYVFSFIQIVYIVKLIKKLTVADKKVVNTILYQHIILVKIKQSQSWFPYSPNLIVKQQPSSPSGSWALGVIKRVRCTAPNWGFCLSWKGKPTLKCPGRLAACTLYIKSLCLHYMEPCFASDKVTVGSRNKSVK